MRLGDEVIPDGHEVSVHLHVALAIHKSVPRLEEPPHSPQKVIDPDVVVLRFAHAGLKLPREMQSFKLVVAFGNPPTRRNQ